MSELTFYTNPMSRGRIVRWILEEVGATYETQYLGYDGGGMKSAAYKAINPMGKVPAIKHGNTVVTECAAICAYIADAFEGELAPPVTDRGTYYRWFFYAAGPLEMAVTTKAMGFEIGPDKQRMAGCGAYSDVMDTLEHALNANRYLAGDQFTAADVYIGSQINWGLRFGSIEKRQRLVDYLTDLQDRPAYKRATQLDDDAVKAQQAAQ